MAWSMLMCLTCVLPAAPAAAADATPSPARLAFRLQDPSINESSGLAVSRRHRGIVWTHNDGGTSAQVIALDRMGRSKALVTLRGIDPFDPEALAPGQVSRGRPALFLGDIGDNRAVRRDISIFRFVEPARVASQTIAPDWFRLRYPDGPHDAEALLVDPRDGRIWIATKDLLRGGLYRAPARLSTQRTNELERVGDVPGLITDGAFLPDGRFVLRSYSSVYLFGSPGKIEAEDLLPPQEQGESLAIDGNELLVGSEGSGSAVYGVPIPKASASPTPDTSLALPTERASAGRKPADGSSTDELSPRVIAVTALGIVLCLFAAVVVARRRRRAATGR